MPVLTISDGPSSSPTRGEKSRKAKLFSMLTGGSSPPKNSRDKPAFVVGGSRIDPKSHAKRTGPAFVVGGARVEPSTQPKHKTGPDFVVGGARIEPSSWPKNSGPFVVGGARVEPRR